MHMNKNSKQIYINRNIYKMLKKIKAEVTQKSTENTMKSLT